MASINCFSEAHVKIIEQFLACYRELFEHSGHGKMSVEMRFLKRGQKEILINCGREYRFTVDCCESCANGKLCEQSSHIKPSLDENVTVK